MVTAPLPGLEPQDIHCQVDGRTLSITAALRGPGQDRTQAYILREWTVSSSERRLDLPRWVDPTRANATFDNGVLVLMLPFASARTAGDIPMVKVGTSKGQRIEQRGARATRLRRLG